MATKKKASKAGARRVTANLDALASLFQNHYASLGIPSKVATDFAYRCDLLSDSIDRRKAAGFFDPASIGEEVSGPSEYDSNNPFMEGHFTQERFNALKAMQVAGDLASNAAKHIADPKLASKARNAAYTAVYATLKRAADEGEDADDKADDKAEAEDAAAKKTAMMAELYNRIRRQAAKKSEEDDADEGDDDADEKEIEEVVEEKVEEKSDDEAKKTARMFGLYA